VTDISRDAKERSVALLQEKEEQTKDPIVRKRIGLPFTKYVLPVVRYRLCFGTGSGLDPDPRGLNRAKI
jgi:hypothetical protein